MTSRLQDHFSTNNNTPGQWEALWKDNYAPWDRGQASPALYDLMKDKTNLVGSAWAQLEASGRCSKRRKRALVPGCGRGYEVLMLAQFGYDAYGLDGSETAIKEANKLLQKTFEQLGPEGEEGSKGEARFVMGDFFCSDWLDSIDLARDDKFDLIYDYTFLCALPINIRKDWSKRMSELLSPTGRLICLEFPLYKDAAQGGPPFALREETYVQHLSFPGEDLEYQDGLVVPKEGYNDASLVRLERWLPVRTHKAGEGTDHISVWASR